MIEFAVAIFARTPGYSAAKSRLAYEVGAAAAEKLYFQSLTCCAELAQELMNQGVDVCWAVAEQEAVADRYWKTTGLKTMYSGEGELGTRLANVYGQLLEVANVGILIGSDSPQLTKSSFDPVLNNNNGLPMIGPARDGGFYLFADNKNYTAKQWEDVEYSTTETRAQLEKSLNISPTYLRVHPDFDDCKSLAQVVVAMPELPTRAQKEFIDIALELLKPSLLEAAANDS